jgi:hypothetical protein
MFLALYDPTISLGTILLGASLIVTIVGAALAIVVKINRDLAAFNGKIEAHATLLDGYAKHMDKQDALILDTVKSVERLVGRVEGLLQPRSPSH